ncbi:unnamed protein product [Linum trigynum]|uniref:Uncharacterized protein n=1 Tax=Linum trigynum TaxID=586398 RepID=A0AAV2GN37_9ROSI
MGPEIGTRSVQSSESKIGNGESLLDLADEEESIVDDALVFHDFTHTAEESHSELKDLEQNNRVRKENHWEREER